MKSSLVGILKIGDVIPRFKASPWIMDLGYFLSEALLESRFLRGLVLEYFKQRILDKALDVSKAEKGIEIGFSESKKCVLLDADECRCPFVPFCWFSRDASWSTRKGRRTTAAAPLLPPANFGEFECGGSSSATPTAVSN